MNSLIVGCGPSTEKIIKYKEQLHDRFDYIIGMNNSFIEFDDVLDFHICLEYRPDGVIKKLRAGNYKTDVPRFFDKFAIKKYNLSELNYQATERSHHNQIINNNDRITLVDNRPDIRKYKTEYGEGLFKGYDRQIVSTAICAIHLAGIMGATKIYLIGMELCFNKQQHFYDWQESICDKQILKKPIFLEVEQKDKKILTIDIYKKSIEHIDRFIDEECKPNGIKVFDFSDGLLKAPVKLNIDDYLIA